jgi:predicted membrane-bound spermidine synthase
VSRPALFFVVAASGACVLALEIVGTRVLGPFYGQSLFLWSALISVTLAALAVGYALGGRIADRGPSAARLALVLAVAGAWVTAIPWLVRPLLAATEPLGLRSAVLATATCLFFPPLALLGMTSPYAIRLAATRLERVGSTAGDLFAISTVASVVAALATGFWLIPTVGVRALLAAIGAVLFVAAAVAAFAGRRRAAALAIVAAAAGAALGARTLARADGEGTRAATKAKDGVVYRADSPYAELRVLDRGDKRYLLLDGGMHTIVRKDDLRTEHDYVVVGELALEAFERPGRVLVLGLGGGTLCKQFARAGWRVDAVDVDPWIERVAREHFELKPFHATVVVADARRFIARSPLRWNLVFYDAFGSSSIPFHLVTRESFAEAKAHLAPGGVLALNVESVGWHHPLVESLGRTLEAEFRYVTALPIAEPPNQLGNLILLASDRPIDIPYERLGDQVATLPDDYEHWRAVTRNHAWDNRFVPGTPTAPVLTDDKNPVDLWSEEINLVARRSLHAQLGSAGGS